MVGQSKDMRRMLARVERTDAESLAAYLLLRDGTYHVVYMDNEDEFETGQIVLVGPTWDDVEVAPAELWQTEPWIGIVRLVKDDEVLIAIGDRLRTYPRPHDLELEERYTVEGRDPNGVTRVIAEHPVRQIEISLGEPIDLSHFKFEPTGAPSFEDFGGYAEIVDRVQELIEVPLKYHEPFVNIGARPIKGVLFTGESGTGKTMLGRVIANSAEAQFYLVKGPEIISKWLGESEEVIRRIFEDAKSQKRAIIFFDEIDSVAPQRADHSHEASRRIVGQLLTEMDGFEKDDNVIVIATTNRPQDIDVALRRSGRFDWQIKFPLPSALDREAILISSARELSVDHNLPHSLIAQKTESWSPADLAAIWSEAALLAVRDGRDVILEEDYFGGFERVATQRVLIAESRRLERAVDSGSQ